MAMGYGKKENGIVLFKTERSSALSWSMNGFAEALKPQPPDPGSSSGGLLFCPLPDIPSETESSGWLSGAEVFDHIQQILPVEQKRISVG
jgi:hypothetical protein